MSFFLLINVKMTTVVGILTFMSRKNSIVGLSEPEKAEFLDIFILMSIKTSCLANLSMKKSFITSGPVLIFFLDVVIVEINYQKEHLSKILTGSLS